MFVVKYLLMFLKLNKLMKSVISRDVLKLEENYIIKLKFLIFFF